VTGELELCSKCDHTEPWWTFFKILLLVPHCVPASFLMKFSILLALASTFCFQDSLLSKVTPRHVCWTSYRTDGGGGGLQGVIAQLASSIIVIHRLFVHSVGLVKVCCIW
jgi:hypothetical protein